MVQPRCRDSGAFFLEVLMLNRKHPITFDDLMRIERVSNPAPHPSGKYAAYVITKHDHKKNRVRSSIWLIDLDTLERRELTPGEGSHSDPAWSPDGRTLAFVSDRDNEKQLWLLPFEGGEARKLTQGEGGASGPVWSPDGHRMAFTRDVVVSPHWDRKLERNLPEKDRSRIARARAYGLVNEQSSARIETSLLYRHWDHWREMKRSHLFLVDVVTEKTNDVTPGDADVPPISLGGSRDYEFSPKGDEIAYVKNPDKVVALSTNNCIFRQRLNGIKRAGKPQNISTTKATDLDPRYSPDGRFIAYLGAERPTYEADRLRIKLYDRRTGKTRTLTENLDRSASNPVWSEDGKKIFFLADDLGYVSLYSVDVRTGRIAQHTAKTTNSSPRLVRGRGLLFCRQSSTRPADLYLLKPGRGEKPFLGPGPRKGAPPKENLKKITGHGDWLARETEMNRVEEFWYRGADDDLVHGFLLKPPGFKRGRKYPAILIIHGGPQGAFTDDFHYRWNSQMFASEGHVVIMPNPRGSTGYGQEFCDQISGDWGGRCYEDLMKGLDYCIKKYPFIDKNRIAAAGASFGGFMANWIAGHTDRFRAIVSHDGVFNAETMAYMTDELWFDRWEHGGMPHENRESFLKYSPHLHVDNFKTPMLVVQGEQDFRCTISEGISLFTALQVKKVPSKLLYFPDEGHWVLKPANSHVWYRTILDFIGEYTKRAARPPRRKG